jgi:tRNA pseudouridine55 synthase
VAGRFVGEIEQVPPKYSAIKINGKRAYELARAGKEFEMQPREVTIHSIKDVSLEGSTLRFVAHVGSGTYIRTLVEDIGKELGCDAYACCLRRIKVGSFKIDEALQVDQISTFTYTDK